LVRWSDRVFASGLYTIPDAKPLNNCLPLLFARVGDRWQQVYKDEGRTREPCPLVVLPDGRVIMSINPTLTEPDRYNGPSRPQLLEFSAAEPTAPPRVVTPRWSGQPKFTEHSYRSFAADGRRGELILFQNIGYTHAEWAFRDSRDHWAAAGKLIWPWGAEYDKPQPIRLCYATVALKDRKVYFCAVSDIIEPYTEWRQYKRKLTGREWDYDFRRLFFTWSDDITTGRFHPWLEVASRDKTCGHIWPCDLYVDPAGRVQLVWTERAIDERLRDRFFPEARQEYLLQYAVVDSGRVRHRVSLLRSRPPSSTLRATEARFHITEQGRLLVIHHVRGRDESGRAVSETRLTALGPDGKPGEPTTVPLNHQLRQFFTATPRAGCRPANVIDCLGTEGRSVRYARIRVEVA
jgi:hypothetical protein